MTNCSIFGSKSETTEGDVISIVIKVSTLDEPLSLFAMFLWSKKVALCYRTQEHQCTENLDFLLSDWL